MKILFNTALPKFGYINFLIENPICLATTIPSVVAVSNVVSYKDVWFLLSWFILADLLSGIAASYFTWKKSEHTDRFFFGKGEGFSSDKAKKFGVKLVVYMMVPKLILELQNILMLKKLKYETISDAEFEIATIVVLFFCLIEGFSIFHENLPKCGVDIWGSVKKIINFVKEVKNETKSNNDNSPSVG